MNKHENAINQITSLVSKDFDSSSIRTRIDSILASMKSITDEEMIRYFPVAAIGCLEKAFRWAIKTLLNQGEPYASNASDLYKEKFSVKEILTIESRVVTTADLVSHLVPFSSLGDIETQMKQLIGRSFLDDIRNATHKWTSYLDEPDENKRILTNADTVIHAIEETFKLRHSFCHEIDFRHRFSSHEIKSLVFCTLQFVDALIDYVEQEVGVSATTQADMNGVAYEDFQLSQEKLNRLVKRIEANVSRANFKSFNAVQKRWEAYAIKEAEFIRKQYGGGTLGIMAYYATHAILIHQRISSIESFIHIELEFPTDEELQKIIDAGTSWQEARDKSLELEL
ncbi:MAG: DUF1311 domain-containing protein [Candidatus Melainabacteria bacterium]|nr:MAG: DUF1311 domain-containing protein [Candidatus Melainabacteria bacterium]